MIKEKKEEIERKEENEEIDEGNEENEELTVIFLSMTFVNNKLITGGHDGYVLTLLNFYIKNI